MGMFEAMLKIRKIRRQTPEMTLPGLPINNRPRKVLSCLSPYGVFRRNIRASKKNPRNKERILHWTGRSRDVEGRRAGPAGRSVIPPRTYSIINPFPLYCA